MLNIDIFGLSCAARGPQHWPLPIRRKHICCSHQRAHAPLSLRSHRRDFVRAPSPRRPRGGVQRPPRWAVHAPPEPETPRNVGRRPVHCGWRTPPRNLKPNGMLSSADGARRPTQCVPAKMSVSFATTVTTWHVKTWRVAGATYFPCGHTLLFLQKRNNTHILFQHFNSTL